MMKTLLMTILAALLVAAAPDYEPSTTWPYAYPDFVQGTIVMTNGTSAERQMNVCLSHGELHYIDSEIVKEASLLSVAAVEIGKDVWIPVEGSLMLTRAKGKALCIVEEKVVDFNALNSTPGAYGSSSTSTAATKMSSLQLSSKVNQNHMLLLKDKFNGKELPLISKLYVVAPGIRARAGKSEFMDALSPGRQAEFKAWMKGRKIRWGDPVSLLQLEEFLSNE